MREPLSLSIKARAEAYHNGWTGTETKAHTMNNKVVYLWSRYAVIPSSNGGTQKLFFLSIFCVFF
jgi:hypothetical protein